MSDWPPGHGPRCEAHGKRLHPTRRAAKRVIRLMAERGMREYPCDSVPGWHCGHMPKAVRRGDYTMREIRAINETTREVHRGEDAA